jgi:uncharacterized protein YdeI (YjbR/CyaY-like superfamily)
MEPIFFATPALFRKWLARNHDKASGLLVGFFKKASGKPSMTWPQSVDEALCFGWIDGVRRRIDDVSYSIRFTPRKKTSNWSAINMARVKDLTQRGLMQPAGLSAFEQRREEKSVIYAYENAPRTLAADDEKKFKANSVHVLQWPAPVLPARRDLLGDEREEAGDARAAAEYSHR